MEKIVIDKDKEFITLGQLLKIKDFISSGGEAKFFLENNYATINSEKDNRRGRKIYRGDLVIILDRQIEIK